MRIEECGGRVEPITDDLGNHLGPQRVWKKYVDTPGLAMSRSIGDTVSTTLGVVPTPIVT
jgi:hypothetical protein